MGGQTGEADIIYLMTHSTHLILHVCGVRHMVKDHTDSHSGTGEKDMFYLMTHSTHLILQLYGVRHLVEDNTDSHSGTQERRICII